MNYLFIDSKKKELLIWALGFFAVGQFAVWGQFAVKKKKKNLT